jgi:hypothetical protein
VRRPRRTTQPRDSGTLVRTGLSLHSGPTNRSGCKLFFFENCAPRDLTEHVHSSIFNMDLLGRLFDEQIHYQANPNAQGFACSF